jgi:3-hydroxymyristoyl/3-hydroxydecanoyl-(acyl carrier protein) dehydratase
VVSEPAAEFSLPPEHPVFAGHFPGRPLVPGVMLLHWVLREARSRLQCEARSLQIRECKFFDPLLPGERADLFLETSTGRCAFRIRRGDKVLAAGVLELSRD